MVDLPADFKWDDPKTSEEGYYDETPVLIERMLNDPPLLPGESKAEFIRLYDEFSFPLIPESPHEHWLVWHLTVLTWEVMRYLRMKIAHTLNQRRAAVSALIRKAFLSSAMRKLRMPGSDIDDNIDRYFSDPDYPPLIHKGLEAAGYTAQAIEAEMFSCALPALSQLERLIASAEKRLTLFFRENNKILGDRAARVQEVANERLNSEAA